MDALLGLELTRDQTDAHLLDCPGLLIYSAVSTELLPVLKRIHDSRKNKYTFSGSYEV